MLLNHFNKTLDEWLTPLQHYDFATLLVKPDPSYWSLGQLYMHLIAETTWYFDQIRICFDNLEHNEKEMSESAKVMFQQNSFPNSKIKGDPFIADNIPQPADIQAIKNALEKLKIDADVLWSIMEKKEIYGKSEHPGLHYFSPLEWLQFSEMHMRHHLKQKSRIDAFLKSNGYKKGG